MRYNLFTLGELVTIKYGKNQKKVQSEDGTVPIYGTGGLMGYATDALYDKPSVLIGRKGTINKVRYVDHPFWTVDTLFYTEVNENLVIPKYLYYLMSLLDLDSYNEGTTIPSLRTETLNRLEFDIPDLDYQGKVLSMLEPIDGKIKLNEEVNNNLADLLQTVYQDRFGNTSLVANQGFLSDICSYSRDKVAVSELNVSTYFSTENMLPGKAGSTEATSLPTTPQTTACHKGDTLISNIRPYFKKIVYCEDKCGCSTDVLCFTPSQPRYSAYLFSTLYADKFFAFMVAGSKGTKMPRGDKQQIMTYPVVLPSEEELAGYNTIASPLLKQIYSNRAENKRLSILRDSLLPKLMSGELNVSAVQL
jgi:type I restriction enzyme S subunit